MNILIPFGDPSGDGHGQCEFVSVETPNPQLIFDIQARLKQKYGQDFFEGFANEYEEPYFSEKVCKALNEVGYKGYYETYDTNTFIELGDCINAFIYLLNAYGAQITKTKLSPILGHPFEEVGYGCFQ